MSSDAPLEPNRHEVANVSYPANDFQRDKLLVARRGTVGALPPSQSDIQGASRTRATSSSHVTTQTTWTSPRETPLRTRRTQQQNYTKTDTVLLLMHPIGSISLVHARRKIPRVSHLCFGKSQTPGILRQQAVTTQLPSRFTLSQQSVPAARPFCPNTHAPNQQGVLGLEEASRPHVDKPGVACHRVASCSDTLPSVVRS